MEFGVEFLSVPFQGLVKFSEFKETFWEHHLHFVLYLNSPRFMLRDKWSIKM